MPNSDDLFLEIQADLDVGKDGDPYLGKIVLTEGGELSLQFDEGVVESPPGLDETWETITGRDERGFDVEISEAAAIQNLNFSLTRIRPRSIVI